MNAPTQTSDADVRVDRWRKASVALGAWMSAALDDPKVCDAMKADINEWFSAGEPFIADAPTLSNKVVDTEELADPQVVVAGKLLTIKPGAPEIALLCRAIFRASFADDEDEALVNQKYQEWEEDRAKAIRAARFVLRALGGNGSVVRALRTTQCSGDTQELRAAAIAICKAEARELGYIDEDVADFDNPDGDDLLAVQAVERALRSTQPSGDTQDALEALADLTDAFLSRHGCFPVDQTNDKERHWHRAMKRAYGIVGQPNTLNREIALSALRTTQPSGDTQEVERACCGSREGMPHFWDCETNDPALCEAEVEGERQGDRDWIWAKHHDFHMAGNHAMQRRMERIAAALSLPSDKTVELLREARIAVDVLERAVRFGIPEEQRPDTSKARELLAKLDSHLGEIK